MPAYPKSRQAWKECGQQSKMEIALKKIFLGWQYYCFSDFTDNTYLL